MTHPFHDHDDGPDCAQPWTIAILLVVILTLLMIGASV